MKLRLFVLGIAGLLSFASCEKAYTPADLDLPATTGASNGSLLLKSVLIENTDTTVTIYGYNTSKQLTKLSETLNSGGTVLNKTYRLIRDANGKVIQVVLGNLKPNATAFTDSIVQNVHYPAGSPNFDYELSLFSLGTLRAMDSTAFAYTNGHITNTLDYRSKPGSAYTLAGKIDYTYDLAENLSILAIYTPATTTANDTLTVNFFYDDKKATLQLGNEAHLIGAGNLTAKNNIIKAVSVSTNGTRKDTSTTKIVYQYNTGNFPVSAVIENPGGIISRASYYYQ